MKSELSRVAIALASYKVICFAFILLSVHLLPPLYSEVAREGNFHRQLEPEPSPDKYFSTWDAQLYLFLSERGYDLEAVPHGFIASAFYPTWPTIIRIGASATGTGHVWVGVLLANLFSWAALVAFYRYIRLRADAVVAKRALVLMLAFPGALFWLFPYAEAAFLFFSVLVFLALEKKYFFAAAACAFLAAAIRPTGFLWCVPLAVHFWIHRKQCLPLALLPLGGPLLYMATLHLAIGDYSAAFTSQQSFVAQRTWSNVFNPLHFIEMWTQPLVLHGFTNSIVDRCFFLAYCALCVLMFRGDKTVWTYTLVMGMLPALTSLMSHMRHLAVIFPLFLAVATMTNQKWRDEWFYFLVLVLGLLQVLFLLRHINFYWAA